MEQTNRFMGGGDFYWFFGVVECASDPEKLGRVRVRAVGDHTQDKAEIPTEDLPWAMTMMPVTSASMSGIGDAPVGLVQGSWVVGFYRDGIEKQQPIIMGSIGGLPIDEAKGSVGFNDPKECFPDADKLSEPDTNRAARGTTGLYVNEPASVTARKGSTISRAATCTGTWDEPETPYAPVYPYNQVWEGPYNPSCDECEWGHIEEWDSTPGSERYFRQHKTSQNFLEIHPDGTEVRKIYGDGFEIDIGNKHLYIEGDYKVTIHGNKDERIKGDYWQHVEGDKVVIVDGESVEHIEGDKSTTTQNRVIQKSKKGSWDLTEESIMRVANKNIVDSAKEMALTTSTEEVATGILGPPVFIADINNPGKNGLGQTQEEFNELHKEMFANWDFDDVVVDKISPATSTGDWYPLLTHSCSDENSGKIPRKNNIIPDVPAYTYNFDQFTENVTRLTKEEGMYFDFGQNEFRNRSKFVCNDDAHFGSDVLIGMRLNVEEGASIGWDTALDQLYCPDIIESIGTPWTKHEEQGEMERPEATEVLETDQLKPTTNLYITTDVTPGDIYECDE